MTAIIMAIYLAISTPLPGHLTYTCAGSSDTLRDPYAVWSAVAARKCTVSRMQQQPPTEPPPR
jgi:hypothetical protein